MGSAVGGASFPQRRSTIIVRRAFSVAGAGVVLGLSSIAAAADYHVGNGQEYSAISDVPLGSLQPGDTVFVHYKSQPYRERFGIRASGSSWDEPVRISGVAGPNGELPVIDGGDAIEGPDDHPRGVITVRPGAEYVVVENLELRGAHPDNGYSESASGAYAEGGSHLLFQNITFTDNGNGFFSNAESSDVIVRGCRLYGNGIVGKDRQHNSYTESDGITFEYNQYGKLRPGALGNNLKDRSAHMVVRYNWIEGGNRTLDLVESQEGLGRFGSVTQNEAHYVYGNVLIKLDDEPTNNQNVHFGGEGSGDERRVMYFYNNTLLSVRPKTNMIWINGDNPNIDIRNNVFHTFQTPSSMRVFDTDCANNGQVTFVNNFVTQGYDNNYLPGGLNESGTILGASPGFDSDGPYIPSDESPLIGGAAALTGDEAAYPVQFEYQAEQQGRARSGMTTIGAFEVCVTGCGGDVTPPEPRPGDGGGDTTDPDEVTDEPTTDEPTPDEPTTDEPTPDEPTPDEPTTDEPTPDEPTDEPDGTSEPEDSTDDWVDGDAGAGDAGETPTTAEPPAVGSGRPMLPPMHPGPDGKHGTSDDVACSVASVGAMTGGSWPSLAWLMPLALGLIRRRR